ncbi:hypothetical protein AYO38_10550 [bacterium SCGC AG-212-C10]|nr:hypothetical protein AYO38_10550 [bacterium SCGC AG-212-C10]
MPFRDAWLIVGGLLIFAGFAAEQPPVLAIGVIILVVGAVSRFWGKHLFDRVTMRRSLSQKRAFLGEKVPYSVELENKKLLPMPWYEWRISLDDAVKVEGEALAASAAPGTSSLVRKGALGWYEKHNWTFQLQPDTRGYHILGPGSVKSSDILGLWPLRKEDEEKDALVVFPRIFTMEELGLPADRPMGERKGRNRLFEDPQRVAGLRDYHPGDPLKRIDWKATARRGELQSRVYEPSATHQLYILVNIDTLAHSWEGYLKDDLERTISTAASLAVWAAGARYSVGLLANGSFPDADRPIRLAPSRSRDQLTKVLEALAVIQPLTMGDLAEAAHREAGRVPQGSTILLVAALIPPPLAGAMARFASEGHRVAIMATSKRVEPDSVPGVPVQYVAGLEEWEGAAR